MLKHMIRRTAVPVILLLAVSVTGCGSKPTPAKVPASTPAPTPAATQTVQPAPTSKETKIKTYFADANLTKLIEKESTLTYGVEADKYKKALQMLQVAPDSSVVSLLNGITIQSALFQDGLLTVNMTISDQGRLGAPGEQLLIEALKKAVFQFSEVKTLELLVDGKKTDTLMGHMDVPHPIKR